jgi:hypothetical protein
MPGRSVNALSRKHHGFFEKQLSSDFGIEAVENEEAEMRKQSKVSPAYDYLNLVAFNLMRLVTSAAMTHSRDAKVNWWGGARRKAEKAEAAYLAPNLGCDKGLQTRQGAQRHIDVSDR